MTKTQAALVSRVERSQRIGDITRADALALCALVRQQDAQLSERAIPGHVARMIDVLLERVSAGDSARSVVEDYGPWEWNRGPSLAVLVRLVRLRDAVREFATNYPLDEYADWRDVLKALKRAGGGRRKP